MEPMARRGTRSAPPAAGAAASEPAQSDQAGGSTTRERILDIALDLFIRKGYAETSLREIAAELGFSKAALYYHFESKQDILLALHMRVHGLTDGVLPMLQAEADASDIWERLIGQLIGLALQNRRLIELHIRNQEAIAEIHRHPGLAKHGPIRQDVDHYVLELLRDPSLSVEGRVRRTASLGAIAAVLLAASAFTDVSDVELEPALRTVVHNLIGGTTEEAAS
jgi:AcrR family transcriptional regulator